MTPVWIALFFSSMSVLNSPTTYMSVIEATTSLEAYHNAFSVVKSTHMIGTYMDSLAVNEKSVSSKKIFRVTEQTVIFNTLMPPPIIASKFLAPLEWIILDTDADMQYSGLGKNLNAVSKDELFTLSTDSIALVTYADNKAKTLKLKYKIYRGQEYLAQAGEEFKFTAK